jgi:hypothetical protein
MGFSIPRHPGPLREAGSKELRVERVEDEEDQAGKKHVVDPLIRSAVENFVLTESELAGLVSRLFVADVLRL